MSFKTYIRVNIREYKVGFASLWQVQFFERAFDTILLHDITKAERLALSRN